MATDLKEKQAQRERQLLQNRNSERGPNMQLSKEMAERLREEQYAKDVEMCKQIWLEN